MIFATLDYKEVDEFLITYSLMVTDFNEYITDYEEFRGEFRGMMEGQFEHDLYNKSFSNQVKPYENDSLDKRMESWLLIVHKGGPIPENGNNYHIDEIFNLRRKAADPEMQQLVKKLKYKKLFHK